MNLSGTIDGLFLIAENSRRKTRSGIDRSYCNLSRVSDEGWARVFTLHFFCLDKAKFDPVFFSVAPRPARSGKRNEC